MKTVNIKGKPYVMVNERIKALRENFEGYRIVTEWIKIDMEECICFAKVQDSEGNTVATGTAFEKAGNGFINKTSHIENAETSAVGRALGIFGIGIDESIATAEEVNNAVKGQDKKEVISDTQVQILTSLIKDTESDESKFLDYIGASSLAEIPKKKFDSAIKALEKKKK